MSRTEQAEQLLGTATSSAGIRVQAGVGFAILALADAVAEVARAIGGRS